MTDKPTLPEVLDNSILTTFSNCERKANYRYLHHKVAHASNVHLHFGGVFAKCIENLYRRIYSGNMPVEDALNLGFAEFTVAWGDFTPLPSSPKTKQNCWKAVETYVERYNPPNDYIVPWEGVENPYEFTIACDLGELLTPREVPNHPSGHPFIYSGKFDLFGKHAGIPRIRDEKTTSGLGPSFEKQFSLRSQFIGYVAACQHLGFAVDTVEVRGVGVLKGEIKHQPIVKTYPDFLVERWKDATACRVRDLVRAWEEDRWEFNLGDSCAAYGGCEYMDLCRSVNPETWFDSYETVKWSPLGNGDEA